MLVIYQFTSEKVASEVLVSDTRLPTIIFPVVPVVPDTWAMPPYVHACPLLNKDKSVSFCHAEHPAGKVLHDPYCLRSDLCMLSYYHYYYDSYCQYYYDSYICMDNYVHSFLEPFVT